MKMREAQDIIENGLRHGYIVHFERREDGMLCSDHFPDKHAGEPAIPTEEQAWHLASMFAAATRPRCVNFYVVNYRDFTPVRGYRERIIDAYPSPRGSGG